MKLFWRFNELNEKPLSTNDAYAMSGANRNSKTGFEIAGVQHNIWSSWGWFLMDVGFSKKIDLCGWWFTRMWESNKKNEAVAILLLYINANAWIKDILIWWVGIKNFISHFKWYKHKFPPSVLQVILPILWYRYHPNISI